MSGTTRLIFIGRLYHKKWTSLHDVEAGGCTPQPLYQGTSLLVPQSRFRTLLVLVHEEMFVSGHEFTRAVIAVSNSLGSGSRGTYLVHEEMFVAAHEFTRAAIRGFELSWFWFTRKCLYQRTSLLVPQSRFRTLLVLVHEEMFVSGHEFTRAVIAVSNSLWFWFTRNLLGSRGNICSRARVYSCRNRGFELSWFWFTRNLLGSRGNVCSRARVYSCQTSRKGNKDFTGCGKTPAKPR